MNTAIIDMIISAVERMEMGRAYCLMRNNNIEIRQRFVDLCWERRYEEARELVYSLRNN